MYIPQILETLSLELKRYDAKAIIVGGSVRDNFLNAPCKDYDVEVYGLKSMDALEIILGHFGKVDLVGKSFGVLKFFYENEEFDFSMPRKERKISKGHKGFDVSIDSTMGFKEASLRRDFTMNAMGYDIAQKKFLDPYNGQRDMQNNILKHIDDATFIEDPLRVYRAIQFCARFGYGLDDNTFFLCQKMVEENLLEELPKERVYSEFKKLLLKSPKPSIGFELLRELGIIKKYFPELHAIIDVPQSPKWHPEGDVWIHTMMCIDEMAQMLVYDEKSNLKYMFAILCHDFGKAITTTIEADGKIRAIDHEYQGIKPTQSFLYRLSDEHDFIKSILPLVEHHLKPSQFYRDNAKDKAIRKLALKVNIEDLIIVAKADFLGRTTPESLERVYHAGSWLLERAKNLKVQKKPLDNLLQGRDLIALGFSPSCEFKTILNRVYEKMMEGELASKEEALCYVKENF